MLGLGTLLVGGVAFALLRGRPYRVAERPAVATVTTTKPETPPSPPASELAENSASPTGLSPEGPGTSLLPNDAPKSVSFGVIVFTYRGAEGAPGGAPSKEAALARAKALLPEAQHDFDEAVKKGDHGSMVDAGSVPRGVLEPALEYALFTLKKGQISGEPLDSPRGYWIVRRRD
jgi:hypothetical protein